MKIWVTGSSGSGKTTLSNKISKSLNIDVYYSDQITWQENWVLREKKEQIDLIKDITSKEKWLFDGNKFKLSKLDGRFESCNVLIHIEANRLKCFFRVVTRFLKHRNIKRQDLAEGCKEDLDLAHLKSILIEYPKGKQRRKIFFADISKQRSDIKVITDKSTLYKWMKENKIM